MNEPKPAFVIRVRDVWCGSKGKFAEECVTTNEQEALTWFAQWKKEYTVARGYDGYRVTKVVHVNGLPENFAYSL
jgi:hypothetical protein